jgi:hypothetical protein
MSIAKPAPVLSPKHQQVIIRIRRRSKAIVAGISAVIVLSAVNSAFGSDAIKCVRPGSGDIYISVNSRSAFGRQLSCIHGEFVSDLTPCAPANGFSLSAPTGTGRIVQVFDKWPELANQLGGVTQFESTNDSYTFTGHQPVPTKLSIVSRRMVWAFHVSRLSGHGMLLLYGAPELAYECALASPRF